MSTENRQHGDGLKYTDVGNGERLARRHGKDIRYCWQWHKWLVWDGRRWRVDATGDVVQRAKETIRALYIEAANLDSDEERQQLVKHARDSEKAGRIKAMVEMAKSEPGLAIEPDALDRNAWLMNCLNGTVDLKTGKIRSHCREDWITKLAPVEFDPDAACPTWVSFIDKIFASNKSLIWFVQRLLGYCLTGDVSEQVLPIFYGKGANGKSTMLGAVMEMMGLDYAIKAAPDLVLMKRGTHPTERADLFGKRLVACIEADAGRRLAEALVKDLTGGDKQRARRMREDFWQFDPTHKIILAANHKPEIPGTDYAIWRRIRLVPFDVTIPDNEQDKQLPVKLRGELLGIMAWCVRGAVWWAQEGLGAPEEVTSATDSYRLQQDRLGAFVEECCTTNPNSRAKSSELYRAYTQWCQESGERPLDRNAFGESMAERWERKKIGVMWYLGIGIKDVRDDKEAPDSREAVDPFLS